MQDAVLRISVHGSQIEAMVIPTPGDCVRIDVNACELDVSVELGARLGCVGPGLTSYQKVLTSQKNFGILRLAVTEPV